MVFSIPKNTVSIHFESNYMYFTFFHNCLRICSIRVAWNFFLLSRRKFYLFSDVCIFPVHQRMQITHSIVTFLFYSAVLQTCPFRCAYQRTLAKPARFDTQHKVFGNRITHNMVPLVNDLNDKLPFLSKKT